MLEFGYDNTIGLYKLTIIGKLTSDEVINYYNDLSVMPDLPDNLQVLIDCTSAQFEIKPEDIGRLKEAANNAIKRFTLFREAMMVEQPYETVIVTLYRDMTLSENYHFEIFYTRDAALNWLKGHQ